MPVDYCEECHLTLGSYKFCQTCKQYNALKRVVVPYKSVDPADALHYDAGKPGVHFLPPAALLAVGDVFTYGEKKYAAYNWRKGMRWTQLYASTVRHLLRWFTGETNDKESGHAHLAHAAADILMLMDFATFECGTDDREFKTKGAPIA